MASIGQGKGLGGLNYLTTGFPSGGVKYDDAAGDV